MKKLVIISVCCLFLCTACGNAEPFEVVNENGVIGLWYVSDPAIVAHNNTWYWLKKNGQLSIYVNDGKSYGEGRYYRIDGEWRWDFNSNDIEITLENDPVKSRRRIDPFSTREYSNIWRDTDYLNMYSEDFHKEETWFKLSGKEEKSIIAEIKDAPIYYDDNAE